MGDSVPKSIDMEQLEHDAFKALSGAEYARVRLAHALSMGTPSIEDEAYLIKIRVKKLKSLLIKVADRRSKQKLPESKMYKPQDVRDIIGLRLLTLFKNDLQILVRRLLHFIDWSQKPPFSLFYGTSINQCIEEIKIYATSKLNDISTSFIVDEFKAHGFSTSASGNHVPIEVHRKRTEYSSIHIVAWLNGPTQSKADRVPIEIQLRTSLEDVWGEVDHRLNYKPRDLSGSELVESKYEKSVKAKVAEQLKLLKGQLDNASDFAAMIGSHLKDSMLDDGALRPYSKQISFEIDDMVNLSNDPSLRKDLTELSESIKKTYQSVSKSAHSGDKSNLPALVRSLEGCSESIAKIRESVKGRGARQRRLKYVLDMEDALSWYWRALILKSLLTDGEKASNISDIHHALKQSMAIYQRAQAGTPYEPDPVLSFRIGHVWMLWGEPSLALAKHEVAFRALEQDQSIPSDHHLRILIPRSYAQSLWEDAERSKLKETGMGIDPTFLVKRKQNYLDALDVTLSIRDQAVVLSYTDRGTDDQKMERLITLNNIIEYALSYLDSSGDPKELSVRGLHSAGISSILDELVGEGVDKLSRLSFADTVRHCARWLGRRELAVAAAQRALEMLPRRDFGVLLPDFHYSEIESEAIREIEVGMNAFPGFPRNWG